MKGFPLWEMDRDKEIQEGLLWGAVLFICQRLLHFAVNVEEDYNM